MKLWSYLSSVTMRRVDYSTRFKKDLKRFRGNAEKRSKILDTIKMLADGQDIPDSMNPHKLIGDYQGFMELHIEGDLLLIWLEFDDEGVEVIHLVRVGSHSELFG